MKVLLVSHTLSQNSIARSFSHFLALKSLDWDVRVGVPDAEKQVWAPLARETEFLSLVGTTSDLLRAQYDVIIAMKPRPDTLGRVRQRGVRSGATLILDVDDPDFEGRYGENKSRQLAQFVGRSLTGSAPVAAYRERLLCGTSDLVIVSNPALVPIYGGVVVPHCRSGARSKVTDVTSAEHSLRVAFFGTPRPHKGLQYLREAANGVDNIKVAFTVARPPDARMAESWLGEISFGRMQEMLESCVDVVAVPSLDSAYSRGQLPVKIVDAMMHGIPIVGSDFRPIRWAVGAGGVLVEPASISSLRNALVSLRDDFDLRDAYGAAARDRALELFSIKSVANRLKLLLSSAPSSAVAG